MFHHRYSQPHLSLGSLSNWSTWAFTLTTNSIWIPIVLRNSIWPFVPMNNLSSPIPGLPCCHWSIRYCPTCPNHTHANPQCREANILWSNPLSNGRWELRDNFFFPRWTSQGCNLTWSIVRRPFKSEKSVALDTRWYYGQLRIYPPLAFTPSLPHSPFHSHQLPSIP